MIPNNLVYSKGRVTVVVTPDPKYFQHYIETQIDALTQPYTVQRVSATEYVINGKSYIMCSHERTVRGRKNYDLVLGTNYTDVPSYEYIISHHKYNCQYKSRPTHL